MSLQVGLQYLPFKEVVLKATSFTNSVKNLSIIQLSDLHLNPKVRLEYLESLVEAINEKNPDIVVFTGDIIQSSAKKLKEHLAVFKKIIAPCFYVTGNHDIIYDPKNLQEILLTNDIVCLDNKITTLKINNTDIQLIGFADRYSFVLGKKRPIKKLLSQLDQDMFTILLTHQPKDSEYILDARIDIQLSGHTHGGQIYPLNKIIKLFQPYFSGLYTHNKTLLYVTTGLGYWGVNIRFKVPSEIPLFRVN